MAEVTVIGGGVIGLSIAFELAEQGLSVRVLDRGEFGKEASWAGAGMLPPGNPDTATGAEPVLRSHSSRLWSDWSVRLQELTGIDNEYHVCGGLQVRHTNDVGRLDTEVTQWKAEGVRAEPLEIDDLLALESELHPGLAGGYRLRGMAQVRNPRHLKALIAACRIRGVEMVSFASVDEIELDGGSIQALRTTEGRFVSDTYVIAGGAWSRRLLARCGIVLRLEPVRGQIVLMRTPISTLRHVIESGKRYLVPRRDGRLLVGSTEERVGFRKETTAFGVASLIEFAIGLVPSLANASFERVWCGLRPSTDDSLPYLGPVPGLANTYIAAGHFRAGLQLSPVTAVLVRQLIQGQTPLCDLTPYRADRSENAIQFAANTEE